MPTALALLIVTGLCTLAVVARRVLSQARCKRRWRRLFERHRMALSKRYRQLVRLNEYGFEEREKWHQELRKFRDSVGLRLKDPSSFNAYATRLIGLWVFAEDRMESRPLLSVRSAEDYEHFCADLLRRAGWRADVTQLSGDQGVDVIAEKGDLRVALQCKLRSSNPIGNKAVQEVYAAAGYVDAAYSAVVSNSTYTPAARSLAGKLHVLLLHHSELDRLHAMLETGAVRPPTRRVALA